MNEKRVKYFSNNDWSASFHLERLKNVLGSLNSSQNICSINDALELVNIVEFINNGLFDVAWSQDYIAELKSKAPSIRSLIGKYFARLTANDISKEIKFLDNDYYDDFITEFSVYKLGNKVSNSDFKNIIFNSKIPLWEILKSRYLVKKYPNIIKELFLSKPHNFEIFLSNYTYSHNKTKLYFPDNISKEEMSALCNSYVGSDDVNPNYLDILMTPIKGTERYITIDTSMKLKIKKRIVEIQNRLFPDLRTNGLKVKIAVLSSKQAYDNEIKKSSSIDIIEYIDGSWIQKHSDYPTLLNNFQYLYNFFSDDLISTLPSSPNKEMGLEKFMGVKTENSYMIGQVFELKHQLVISKMRILTELLSKKRIRIENIIDWFFSSYSREEFGVEWLPLNMPSKNENIGNKTATLFRIEESLRKQYSILMDSGVIDGEIFNMTNVPPLITLPSFAKNKYAYLSSDVIPQSIMNLLYSDQSSILYIDKKHNSHNFISLIHEYPLKLADFHDYQKPMIEYLIKNNVIFEKEDGILGYGDIHELYAYKKLFADGVIGYHSSQLKTQKALDKMQEKGWVVYKSSLFSTQESDYLNFLLNNSQFDNSWAIRNSYQHGMPAYKDVSKYLFDYYMALLVLMTYVIKINDELALRKISMGKKPAYVDFDYNFISN